MILESTLESHQMRQNNQALEWWRDQSYVAGGDEWMTIRCISLLQQDPARHAQEHTQWEGVVEGKEEGNRKGKHDREMKTRDNKTDTGLC